jgi:hypothetical protein
MSDKPQAHNQSMAELPAIAASEQWVSDILADD